MTELHNENTLKYYINLRNKCQPIAKLYHQRIVRLQLNGKTVFIGIILSFLSENFIKAEKRKYKKSYTLHSTGFPT